MQLPPPLARAVEYIAQRPPVALEDVMKFKTRSYLDGFGAVRSVLDLDALTRQQIVESLDPERDDPLLQPWKRSYGAAIRRALGH